MMTELINRIRHFFTAVSDSISDSISDSASPGAKHYKEKPTETMDMTDAMTDAGNATDELDSAESEDLEEMMIRKCNELKEKNRKKDIRARARYEALKPSAITDMVQYIIDNKTRLKRNIVSTMAHASLEKKSSVKCHEIRAMYGSGRIYYTEWFGQLKSIFRLQEALECVREIVSAAAPEMNKVLGQSGNIKFIWEVEERSNYGGATINLRIKLPSRRRE